MKVCILIPTINRRDFVIANIKHWEEHSSGNTIIISDNNLEPEPIDLSGFHNNKYIQRFTRIGYTGAGKAYRVALEQIDPKDFDVIAFSDDETTISEDVSVKAGRLLIENPDWRVIGFVGSYKRYPYIGKRIKENHRAVIPVSTVGGLTFYSSKAFENLSFDDRLFVSQDKDVMLSIIEDGYKVGITDLKARHRTRSGELEEKFGQDAYKKVLPIIQEKHKRTLKNGRIYRNEYTEYLYHRFCYDDDFVISNDDVVLPGALINGNEFF